MASDIADTIFPNAPQVHSELVNRDVLSASAAKAQRELLHRMLQNSDQTDLGYTALSADAGLFRTVIKTLGFHHKGKGDSGLWHFTDPYGTQRSESVQALWAHTKELVFNSEGLIKLSDLYKAWTAPPFGVKAGLLPIFALAFFMTYRNQLALYIEGTFTSEVTDAHVDEWLQDPTRIAWRFVRIEASEKKMLQALSAALSKRLGTPVAADALDSARAMVGLVYGLPHWVRRTNLLSKETKDVRTLLLHASDPHKVLFADLPLILDTRSPNELAERIAQITGELVDAFEKRLREVEARLLNALDSSGDFRRIGP